jgi:ornithine--oxo-acid transaminase
VLLITDEIQTGLGSIGKMLCAEYDLVRLDIVLLGKALSGGFMHVSAVLCYDKIMYSIKPSEYISTYRCNPLASAIGVTAMDILIK